MKQIDLTGKTAVVTGGAGKIGRALCCALADCGASVAICYYSKEDYAHQLQDELTKKYSRPFLAVQADVTNRDSVVAMKKTVNSSLGDVSIIINNAVIHGIEWLSVLEQDAAAYHSQFESGVMQAVNMAQIFTPDMIAKQYGRIIGINSECAMQMFPYQSAYVSGKRGMDGVYRILAKEVGKHNITVNQVAPGWTITHENRNPDPAASNIKQDFPYVSIVPMGRRGTDEEIANAVCFLASDLATFITGVYLPVCGGGVMPCI